MAADGNDNFWFRFALQLAGAALFASGLAMRLPERSVPTQILSSTGTPPGFLLGGSAVLVMSVLEARARGHASFYAFAVVKAVAVGGLCFATGASALAFVNLGR